MHNYFDLPLKHKPRRKMCGDHKKVRNHCLLCAHAIAKRAKVRSVKLKAAKK